MSEQTTELIERPRLVNKTMLEGGIMEGYSEIADDSEIVNVPFSFKDSADISDPTSYYNHPAVVQLKRKFSLDIQCGYIVLLKLYNCSSCPLLESVSASPEPGDNSNELVVADDEISLISTQSRVKLNNFNSSVAKDPRKVCSTRMHLGRDESFEDYVLLDCVFGIPLFDERLNKTICQRIIQNGLITPENSENVKLAVHSLVEETKHFIKRFQDDNYTCPISKGDCTPYPTSAILFQPSTNKCFSS